MILDEIIKRRKIQLEREMHECSLSEIKKRADMQLCDRMPLPLDEVLKKDRLSCICEVKKASPSRGIIREDFRPVEIAKEYEAAGADAISCLTEEHFFHGSSKYLADIRKEVKIPILRKDFIFDEYQVYEAAAIGADAILLIMSVLGLRHYVSLYKLAENLGLSVLVEVHNTEEIKKAAVAEPKIIGVNNRDLTTFEVDLYTVQKLKPFISNDAVFVSESGIKTNSDMKMVHSLGADAVLIGETLMRSDNITDELHKLREGV